MASFSGPAGTPPSSPWGPVVFGCLFVFASALIFLGVLHHPAPAPATAPEPTPGETHAPAVLSDHANR